MIVCVVDLVIMLEGRCYVHLTKFIALSINNSIILNNLSACDVSNLIVCGYNCMVMNRSRST
jgi:hypothetical protein